MGVCYKVNPNGSVACLKAHLMAKEYAQTNGVDYSDTHFLLWLNSYMYACSLAATHYWHLH